MSTEPLLPRNRTMMSSRDNNSSNKPQKETTGIRQEDLPPAPISSRRAGGGGASSAAPAAAMSPPSASASSVSSFIDDDEAEIAEWMEQLTLEEKFRLLSGQSLWALAEVPRLGIPALTVSDGPHGVRKPIKELSLQESFPATCFPPACALACSWSSPVLREVGMALRDECLHHRVCVLLGPGMNLKRHAGGGRNFEYLSEDPLLSSRLAAEYVRGVQTPKMYRRIEYKVGACVKHYMVNNQESHRFVVNAVVDERSLHELYYRNFIGAIKHSQPATIMCAYNRLNGAYCSEHPDIYEPLRQVWDPRGVVMTDWGATNDRAPAIQVGLDLEMPGSHGVHDRSLHASLHGTQDLEMDAIDSCCRRMLRLIRSHAAVLDGEYQVDFDRQHDLARRAAAQCVVLLQNRHQLLPLDINQLQSIAVVGDFARHARFQGMGSSQVQATKVTNLLDELQRHVSKHGTRVTFATGYDPDDDDPDGVDQALVDEAAAAAMQAQVVLLCVGLPEILESEGFDRTSLQLPAQHNALIKAIAPRHEKVVVLLSNGGTIELCDETLRADAVLEGYLLGQAGGSAWVDVLFGAVSPSGKLAETMPLHKADIVADLYFPGTRHAVEHREGLDVGYRYFDTANVDVRFPFGHGLSYTEFSYTNLQVQVLVQDERQTDVQVTFDLHNVGSRAAHEVAQCYVRDVVASVYRPAHELRDFCKVLLQPGQTHTVTFSLDREAFAFYDIGIGDWVVEEGEFEVQIGSSSRDIRLRSTIDITRGNLVSLLAQESYPAVREGGTLTVVSDVVFASRFGTRRDEVLQEMAHHSERSTSSIYPKFHRNSLLKEIAESRFLGRLLMHIVYTEASKEIKPGPTQKRQRKMVRANVENLPLRTLVLFSKGGLTYEGLDTLIALMNHEYCVATRTALKAIAAAFSDTRSGLFMR